MKCVHNQLLGHSVTFIDFIPMNLICLALNPKIFSRLYRVLFSMKS